MYVTFDVTPARYTCTLHLTQRFDRLILHGTFHPSAIRLVRLLAIVLMIWHWTGCLWWYIGTLPHSVIEPWVDVPTDDAIESWSPQPFLLPLSLFSKYFYASWWAVALLSGLGTASSPQNDLQLIFHILILVTGTLIQVRPTIWVRKDRGHNIPAPPTRRPWSSLAHGASVQAPPVTPMPGLPARTASRPVRALMNSQCSRASPRTGVDDLSVLTRLAPYRR